MFLGCGNYVSRANRIQLLLFTKLKKTPFVFDDTNKKTCVKCFSFIEMYVNIFERKILFEMLCNLNSI